MWIFCTTSDFFIHENAHKESTCLATDAFVMICIVSLIVVQDIEKLTWCYNKWLFRKVLNVPCNEISIVIAFLKYHFVERNIFHIRNHPCWKATPKRARWCQYLRSRSCLSLHSSEIDFLIDIIQTHVCNTVIPGLCP